MHLFNSRIPKIGSRSDWVRLRTLILLRWMAIAGQTLALLISFYVLHITLPFASCLAVIGVSVVANIISILAFPVTKRLSEMQTFLSLLFDVFQLFTLIVLTGGLSNPFVILVIAPVAISASALELRTTVILASVAILLVSLTSFFYIPLRVMNGQILEIPGLFAFGLWAAIITGIIFLSFYSRRIAVEVRSMAHALLATQMALAREQKLTDLGGVVAATAHELGTPLATIKLVSSELLAELKEFPDLYSDALLIRDQTNRCRDILRDMGQLGKDDKHLRQVPLAAALQEAAEPHIARGKSVHFRTLGVDEFLVSEPLIVRSPELIHGLRNLIQNAVDFGGSHVWVEARWSRSTVEVRIQDDGPGYPAQVIDRIGDPFVRQRALDQENMRRPEYEGMGLGLFIAKTLLERTGGKLKFSNGSDDAGQNPSDLQAGGAVVDVSWPLSALEAPSQGGLGLNENIAN
ncbi:MAG: two-component system sensor histidine kinase RegB [Paracoccaceae bacterium]